MKSIFLNKEDKRLKAGWRISLFLIIFWLLTTVIFLIKPFFGEISNKVFLKDYGIVIVLILTLAAFISVSISRKFLDKKTFVSLGLQRRKGTFKDIVFGFFLSGLMAGVFFIILISFNLSEFNGINFGTIDISSAKFNFPEFMNVISIASLSILLLEHILVGFWEELVFRGYLFQNMNDGMGLKPAIFISCIIYGVIHFTNPNAGILSSTIIVLFGFIRIYGYLATKALWLSIGMHIGWNFFQGPIFGFAASGHQKSTLLDLTIISEKHWLTGGDFGPEGSILILPILVFSLLVMKWYSKLNA